MQYKIKKHFQKSVDSEFWKTDFNPGDIISYNPYLDGYSLPHHYYKWETVTREDIANNPDTFEEIKE